MSDSGWYYDHDDTEGDPDPDPDFLHLFDDPEDPRYYDYYR